MRITGVEAQKTAPQHARGLDHAERMLPAMRLARHREAQRGRKDAVIRRVILPGSRTLQSQIRVHAPSDRR
jgi:hypothetical protein